MSQSMLILLAIFIPVLWGLVLLVKPEFKSRKALLLASGAGLVVAGVLGSAVILGGEQEVFLLTFGKNMNIFFSVDNVSRLFAVVVTVVWMLAGFYAFDACYRFSLFYFFIF